MIKSSGIYQIKNNINGKRYIGSTVNFEARWRLHKINLNKGTHHSKHLQSSWNKNGESCFEFEILEICCKSELLIWEQIYIDLEKPEYNICRTAGSCLGIKRSEETCAKLSLARTSITPEERAAINLKISIANKGKKRTPEQNAANSERGKGKRSPMKDRVYSEEVRANMSKGQLGRKDTEETKAKKAESQRNRSPESRAKATASNTGKKRTPEQIKVTSEAAKRQWNRYRERKFLLSFQGCAL